MQQPSVIPYRPSGADQRALRRYWDFYDSHRAEVRAEIVSGAAAAGVDLRSPDDPDIAALELRINELQREAILEGRWDQFLASLRELGGAYHHAGVQSSTWTVRATAFRDAMRRQVEELLTNADVRAVYDGLLYMLDISREHVLEGYLAAKEQLIRRGEERLRQTEQQLRQSQKMEAIGRLAGGIAHDFNNLLTVVDSYASILEESLDDGDERRADASEIRRAAERAAGITRQLLTMSRHRIAAPRSTHVEDVVKGFSSMLRRIVGEQVTLTIGGTATPTVLVDVGQLEQVLLNVAVNARDAMPDGGQLSLETSTFEVEEAGDALGLEPGTYALLTVTDTGMGMDPDTRRRIFDPFFTTKEPGRGTGLGLSIVHGIISQAGGAISVYSEPGRGSTFRIHLPATADEVEAPRVVALAAPRTLPAMTVLVVDNDRDVRELAARVLREAGCRVLEAASAAEARRACVSHEGAIEVVVLDLILPDGRGERLVRELCELRPGIRVVLASGYPAAALDLGGGEAPDLLAKPYGPASLRAAVARAVGACEPARSVATAAAAVERRPRVLLVEDETGLRVAIELVLRNAGCVVVAVGGVEEAQRELGAGSFDVIVSDLYMPGGNGMDLMRTIRRVDLDVPIILMSGAPSVATATAAVEYGAFRYLTKPLDFEALPKTVQHAARAHALARLRREAFSLRGPHLGTVDRAGLEVRFDQALDGLWLAFQPIVEARGGALYGVEALVRSAEPTMAGPLPLLEAATQLGHLPRLGRRVRALAAAALAPRGEFLFVNLHPEDLADVELIEASAPLSAIAPRVVLEITERASLASSTELTARLARLRALGFRLAVDDIGAGYSGLTSFTQLTPEVVKIDMSLVRDVHLSAVKQRTIGALCRLCHDVGAAVVGEGVETPDERDALVELGCDLLQGYLIARPDRKLPL